jgi:hypothetical protein
MLSYYSNIIFNLISCPVKIFPYNNNCILLTQNHALSCGSQTTDKGVVSLTGMEVFSDYCLNKVTFIKEMDNPLKVALLNYLECYLSSNTQLVFMLHSSVWL